MNVFKKLIKKGKYINLNSNKDMNSVKISLIQSMLQVDPAQRANIDDLLKHEYFKKFLMNKKLELESNKFIISATKFD